MATNREKLRDALRTTLIPFLQQKGFTGDIELADSKGKRGSYDFRCVTPEKVLLFNIQLDKYGRGRFIISISEGPLEGVRSIISGELIAKENLRTTDMVKVVERRIDMSMVKRLYPGLGWAWFRCDQWLWFFHPDRSKKYEMVANKVVNLFPQVEQWWNTKRRGLNIR